jgi:aminomuconate-semialdehyde/2-hydroxymuconate-6-semialdehyde dehydrogenase
MSVEPRTLLNFIGGELSAPANGSYLDSVNPATGAVCALVPDSSGEDLERAVVAASQATRVWQAMGVQGRAAIMVKLADLLDEHLEELVQAEIDDNGMTHRFASAVEVPRGAQNFRSFAKAALEFCQPRRFQAEQAQGYVCHEPVGVVGTISPWNLPLLSFTWKIAPALASGNCVIAKPSEVTPLTAFLLSTLANEAGFPPGVLNVLHGTGPEIGHALTKHPKVARLSFTGSTATGRIIGLTCAQEFKKPPMLEMGGKNPSLVFPDANFEAALECVQRAAFANQGQICLCGSRIYVHRSIYDSFRDALVQRTRAIKIGDPLDPGTQHGASISDSHMAKVLSCIDLAKEEGATVLCGGRRHRLEGRCAAGYFVEPTLLEGLGNDSRTQQEEIFGPVATLTPFDSEEEAIDLANQSEYGLAASIWTQDPERATRVADALQVGMPWVNCWNLRVLETPFGGFKNSGNGHREGVPDAMEFFTEKKTVTMAYRKD